MAFRSDTRAATEDANTQIARLREQVETLMKDRVTPAMADFAGRAENAVANASETVRGQADAISGQVRERPLISILIAAGVGWAIGRIMR
jgi:ElaB/YqjD/DUF883 family membrane-anchored ribosome-binding protein